MVRSNLVFAHHSHRRFFSHPSSLTYLAAFCCLILIPYAAGQPVNQAENSCSDPAENFDVRISACTTLINAEEHGEDYLAIAFNNRGNGYKDKGDYDHAIQDFGEALLLKPDFALAFYNRANAFESEGDYDRAIRDYDRAIRFAQDDSNRFYAFYGRGYAYNAMGKYDSAIQDFDQALRIKPGDAGAFIVRGIAKYFQADLAGAVSDFQRGGELNPQITYDLLWRHLALKRLGRDDTKELAERTAKADPAEWPAPILKLYLGKLKANEVLAAATYDPDREKVQKCEASFFAGEEALINQSTAVGKGLLEAALAGCPRTNIHYDAAAAELRRLNALASAARVARPEK